VAGGYAELHCRTNFSFLEGASHPDELVARAAELGYAALAVTDQNSLAGVVRAHVAAKEAGLKLVIGAAVTPQDAPPVLLWVSDRAAYSQLTLLLTKGRRAAPKGECRLRFDDVAGHSAGLLAGVLLERATVADLCRYRGVFGDRCYAVAELHRGPHDRRLLGRMMDMARSAHMPLVAANDVHYHVPKRRFLQDVLTATRHRCTVAELGDRCFPNGERYLKSAAEMTAFFESNEGRGMRNELPSSPIPHPSSLIPQSDAVARTVEVAQRCTFSLDELRYHYPEELCPLGSTPFSHLTSLAWEGACRRYPQGVPDKVRGLLERELGLIAELRYEAYFLTVWDLVRFARGRGILCQGRGSAANSAVCFCLGVTSVDPGRIDVLFERFVSKERDEAPDIDVDFEHERREEVIQYVYEKYGRERAGMTAEVITYQARSAVRDVGKALGLSLDRIDVLAKAMDHHHDEGKLAGRFREAGFPPETRLARQCIALTQQLIGFPRHLSQHVGGMVMTRGPLSELVPIENAAMPGRTVVEWDKNDLDALGILKVDCLALGMLTAIRKCFDLIEAHWGRPLTLATVPAEDPAVYEMIGRADTIGVFQIESRAQMSMLPRLKPNCFYDLVIEVAIVRPGPIQGDMVHPYLRRRAKEEAVDYPDDRVRAVLEKTLGVPIFQEQAMRLAVVAAGFTPGEADQLRRAMGAWRRRGVMEQFRKKLLDGMERNGYSTAFAERVFRQIQGFGEYGFPESHAASFALLVYVAAWLKCYYPAAFTAALLNSQPMGFYAAAQLVADAKKHGVEVRPIDVNASEWDCTLERTEDRGLRTEPHSLNPQSSVLVPQSSVLSPHPSLRLGFRMVRGLGQQHGEQIVQQRRQLPFVSFDDFVRRTSLPHAALKKLAQADVFRSLHLNRRASMWQAAPPNESLPLFDMLDRDEPPAALPALAPIQEVLADYGSAGLTLRQHPMSFLRSFLDKHQVVCAAELARRKSGDWLTVAGVVLLRQRPSTAGGITFVTLEDETGMVNLIVRPEIWERYRRAARAATVMLVHGRLQHEHKVIHVLAARLEDLSAKFADLSTRSRDFR
jgi:error-prone DNA polymerase